MVFYEYQLWWFVAQWAIKYCPTYKIELLFLGVVINLPKLEEEVEGFKNQSLGVPTLANVKLQQTIDFFLFYL